MKKITVLPLVLIVLLTSISGNSSEKMKGFSVEQVITVYHQIKQIDLEYNIPDWSGEHNRQLRVLFPLNMEESADISRDIHMGMVHVGKDELKMSPRGWAWGGTYRQMPEEIHPREIQNFMSANGNSFKFSITSHEEGWKNGFHFGVESNHPFRPVLRANKQSGNLPAEKSFDVVLHQEIDYISKTNLIEENPVGLNQMGKVIKVELGKNAVDTYMLGTNF